MEWVTVKEFATQLEAEMARARLESEEIPSMIASHGSGVFGAGFQGPIPGGVELRVPRDRLAEVRDVLDQD